MVAIAFIDVDNQKYALCFIPFYNYEIMNKTKIRIAQNVALLLKEYQPTYDFYCLLKQNARVKYFNPLF